MMKRIQPPQVEIPRVKVNSGNGEPQHEQTAQQTAQTVQDIKQRIKPVPQADGEKPFIALLADVERVRGQGLTVQQRAALMQLMLSHQEAFLTALNDPTSRAQAAKALLYIAELNVPPWQVVITPYRRQDGSYSFEVMLEYEALLELIYQSERVEFVDADVVYEKDEFVFWRDTQQIQSLVIQHVPYIDRSGQGRGGLIAAYAYAQLKGGGRVGVVLQKDDIVRAKLASPLGKQNKGPWVEHEPEMWKKTALRRLAKLLPLTREAHAAVEAEEQHLPD